MIIYLIACLILAFIFGGAYYAYRIAFYSPLKGREEIKPVTDPKYEAYRPEMRRIFLALKEKPCEFVTITSRNGLTLSGRYYHVKDGAPLDIGFHGYRSAGLVDFSGGSELCFQMEHNLLLIDQRAHGRSQGRTITFGLQERHDLLKWTEYAVNRFGPDVQITLYGVSMGGATVLMASELPLPVNVKGIVADCPYCNALEEICYFGRTMPIPKPLIRIFAILGAKIYGGFDLRETDCAEAVKHTKVPILIIHGTADTLVPCEMSEEVQKANPEMVTRVVIDGAEHGICYLVDTPKYHMVVKEFVNRILK